MNRKDFEILENADDDTVQKIEKQYPVFDEKKSEEIYKMTMKKMKEQNEITYTEYSEKIEGVEKYKRPVWQRATAAAAAVAILAGGAALFHNLSREDNNKKSDYMKEVAADTTDVTTTETTTANTTGLLDYEEYIELMQPKLDVNAEKLYKAANRIICEMYAEKESNELCIVSSDESRNYNLSVNFDTDLFYNKLKYYLSSEEFKLEIAEYDYFFVIQNNTCIYAVCEKKKFDDIYDFPSDPKNNTDSIDTGLIATFPHESILTEVREKGFGITDISDLMETPTSPRPTIYELQTICERLIDNQSRLSFETGNDDKTDSIMQIYEGEDYQEYVNTAVALIDKYEELLDINNFGISYDENDEINFKVIPSEEEIQYMKDATQNYDIDDQKIFDDMVAYYEDIHYGRYNRCTDERFNDIDDIKEYALSIISEDYFITLYTDGLTDKLMGAKDGDTVTSDKCSPFTMYNGKLYFQNITPIQGDAFGHWTNAPVKIYDVTETSFKAAREWSPFTPEYDAAITDPDELQLKHVDYIYTFTRDSVNDEWRIEQC